MNIWHKFDWARFAIFLLIADVVLALFQLDNVNLVQSQWLRGRLLIILGLRMVANFTLCGLCVAAVHALKGAKHE